MTRFGILFLIAISLISHPPSAQAGTFQVGGCLKGYANFLTIQAAVSSVPSGSNILVCPGIYREQVTIQKPLILRGQAFNNQDRPIIALPPNGASVNVTSAVIPTLSFDAQVLVQNVSPAGLVQIIDMTVDGAGGPQNCSSAIGLAGIYFASGTSGEVAGVTTRNQSNGGCGFGIFAENAGSSLETLTIGNDSVHDFDSEGIFAASNQNPSTLAVTIEKNSVTSTLPTAIIGISTAGVTGTISSNVVTKLAGGIEDSEFFSQSPGITISSNVVADFPFAGGVGIQLREGDTARSNKISNVATAFVLQGGATANPGPTLGGNASKDTQLAVEYNCTVNTHVGSNNFIDSQVAYDKVPSGFVIGGGVNVIYDIDTVATGTCP